MQTNQNESKHAKHYVDLQYRYLQHIPVFIPDKNSNISPNHDCNDQKDPEYFGYTIVANASFR